MTAALGRFINDETVKIDTLRSQEDVQGSEFVMPAMG